MPDSTSTPHVVKSHFQIIDHVSILEVPEHEDRDANTQDFDRAKRVMKRLGLTRCIVCGNEAGQQHHMLAEKCLEEVIDFAILRALCRLFSFPHIILGCYAILDARKAAGDGNPVDGVALDAEIARIQKIDFSAEMEGLPEDSVDIFCQLAPICQPHHTGAVAIHFLNFPFWISEIVTKTGVHVVPQTRVEIAKITAE